MSELDSLERCVDELVAAYAEAQAENARLAGRQAELLRDLSALRETKQALDAHLRVLLEEKAADETRHRRAAVRLDALIQRLEGDPAADHAPAATRVPGVPAAAPPEPERAVPFDLERLERIARPAAEAGSGDPAASGAARRLF